MVRSYKTDPDLALGDRVAILVMKEADRLRERIKELEDRDDRSKAIPTKRV